MLTTVTLQKGRLHESDCSVVISMKSPQRVENVSGEWPIAMDGHLAMQALGWWKKGSEGRNSRLSTSAILRWAEQAYIQGSTLAVWEVLLLVQSYKGRCFSPWASISNGQKGKSKLPSIMRVSRRD